MLGDGELGFGLLLFGSEEIERLKFQVSVCVCLCSDDGEEGWSLGFCLADLSAASIVVGFV